MAEDEDPLAVLNDAERSFLTRIVATKILPTLEALARGGTAYAFEQWILEVERQREVEAAIALEEEVKRIMKESVRGQRSAGERESLRKYISKLSCVPSEVGPSAMDTLCNEIDSVSTVGKSILFLQGDFGNVYYMIGKGSVQLYLEKSKDREMEIGREFGALRGVPYPHSLTSLQALGQPIVTLQEGQGFGEFAILSQTGKLRMCAAVATSDETFLFVVHASTYNVVLRQHHYRSKQLSACTTLLQELPIFNMYSYSKLSNIAYGMKSSMYSKGTVLVRSGQRVTHALIISSGQVKVLQPRKRVEPKNEDGILNTVETVEARLPSLAHAILGRGCVIGQRELQPNSGTRNFSMTYVSCSHDCEVFEMPANLYRECCTTPEVLALDKVAKLNSHLSARDQENHDRVDRTDKRIREFALSGARAVDEKYQLLRLLPLLIDGVTLDDGDEDDKQKTPNKFNSKTTTADIVTEAVKTEWFDGGGVAYGYDPSVSRDENMSTSDLFASYQATTQRTPTRPLDSRSSRTPRQSTPGKHSSQSPLSPSPRASKTLYASSHSAPNTPRVVR